VLPPEQHQGQEFVRDVRGGDRGHIGVVVGGLASTESLAEVWLAMRTTAAAPEG
jgi:hypothetical protein